MKPLLKKTLGLPSNAANEYLYGSREDGLFGTPLAAEDSDIALINAGFKLLTSNDSIIQKLAWGELDDTDSWRYESISQLNISKYLNSEPSNRTSDKYKSPWPRARQATKRLNVNWRDSLQVDLVVAGEAQENRKFIFKTLRKHLRSKRMQSLQDHANQGKTKAGVTAAKSSCHIFTTGQYTTFKHWRFIHHARLGLFNKLNAYNYAHGHTNKKCRICPKLENLPHVLEHYMLHITILYKNHNVVV